MRESNKKVERNGVGRACPIPDTREHNWTLRNIRTDGQTITLIIYLIELNSIFLGEKLRQSWRSCDGRQQMALHTAGF